MNFMPNLLYWDPARFISAQILGCEWLSATPAQVLPSYS